MLLSSLSVQNFNPSNNGFVLERDDGLTMELPSKCPHCGKAIFPNHLYSLRVNGVDNNNIVSIYLCASCCNFIFTSNVTYGRDVCKCIEIYPPIIENTLMSQSISNLSPAFCKIYNQAATAEKNGLDEISGIGYRKALEFLIKDFSIHRYPDDKENIEKLPLSTCINKYCENSKLKTLATACVWLGNDETHYIRKHEEYSVSELKAFLHAAITFIESELSLDEASKLINPD